jgi:precorrin-6B methylase 2
VTALWAGDVNTVSSVIYQGAGSDATTILNSILSHPSNTFLGGSRGFTGFASAYNTSDINMNATVIYQGANSDATEILNILLSHPSNSFLGGSRGFTGITEQLP